jgi:hypothetical protein
MNPVDLDVVDRMGADTAQRSEQGAQLAEDGLRDIGNALESRSAAFAQGAASGRVAPVPSIGSAARTAP